MTEEELQGEIMEKETVQERIDLVAEDFSTGKDRYKELSAWWLAEDAFEWFLSDTGEGYIQRECRRVDLDEESEGMDYPAYEHMELLKDEVSAERYQALMEQAMAITDGKRTTDILITAEERLRIEDALTEEKVKDGCGWLLCRRDAVSSGQVVLPFQWIIGDSGEVGDVIGPYEIRDNGRPDNEGLYRSELS